MTTIKLLRLGSQVVVALSIFLLTFFLFYTMNAMSVNSYQSHTVRIAEKNDDESLTEHVNVKQSSGSLHKNVNKLSKNPSKDKKDQVTEPQKKQTNEKETVKQLPAVKDESKEAVVQHTFTNGDESRNKTRYLIYLCDRYRYCGGWGDRQRGIPATYVLATVTGRKFGLNMSFPCDIKVFFVPNEINWYIRPSEIRGLSWEIVDWIDNRHKNVDCESDFNERHPSDVVFLRTNQDIIYRLTRSPRYGHLVPHEFTNRGTSWKIGWHKLIKPSIHMEEHVEMIMAKIPTPGDLVCAHIRMRKNPSMPNDSPAINSMSAIPSLWKFLSKYEKNASKIFIATDSLDVRKSARDWFGEKEFDTNGIVLHIDRQGKWSDACRAFEMALIDQDILTRCNVLVMSRSGFSARAKMMSLIKQKLFTFSNGTIT